MSSQGVSSGPSPGDPGLGGLLAGGPDYSAFSPAPDASSGFNASVGAPTVAGALASPQLPPTIGTSGTFSADSSAISGVTPQTLGQGGTSGGSVFDTGTTPIDTFGGIGAISSPPAALNALQSIPSYGESGATASAPTSGPVGGGGSGPGAGGGAGIPAGGGNSIEDLLSKLGQGALKSVTSNPLGILAGGIPLLSQALHPPKLPQEQNLKNLSQAEQQLQQQQQQYGQALQSPLVTGNLLPGQQTSVDNAYNDAVSTTKARYANLGLSGSTMEADAIASISNQKVAAQASIAQQDAQTGSQAISQAAGALGLQDQVYTQLMQGQLAQDQGLQQALARFASAAGGAPQNLTVKLPGQ